MITITNLVKEYGGNVVLKIPRLEISKGQRMGLVGNNGAGKTSFFSILLDLVAPTTGTLFNKEINVQENEAWKRFTTCYLDDNFLIDFLTPEEYFFFIGELRGMNQREVMIFLGSFEDFFHGDVMGKSNYLRDFSTGNRKKVGIAASFLGSPEVVILDEPFANLDPRSQGILKRLLLEWTLKENVTLLISSHDLRQMTGVCNRVVLLDKGTVSKDLKVTAASLDELNEFFDLQTSR